jgi:hypothetical protein
VYVAGIILTVFCGVTALIFASGKLTRQEAIVEILDRVQVSGTLRTLLPYVQIAGGVAALVGLFVLPALGVAALVGLALYYAGAVGFHVRVGDSPTQSAVPLGLTLVAAAAAIIRTITL